MPILDFSIVLQESEILDSDLAQRLANKAASILASAPGTVWVRLHPIPKNNYAENGIDERDAPSPVFVEILKSKNEDMKTRTNEIMLFSSEFSKILNRPVENIHILYLPEASGRIAFGGKVKLG
ncbi:hypothetical protein [Pelagicoccus sp. SDUM812003]|uniref:hypothetical protein n=1 Tax=Pelagicoccus sp. SDUM812003 TaxID=3041267 RepID=UPI00280E1749|nr:hypothetical protein [Pelagicoccus sp. SDUM812003]MDQ8205750.1 hypothetical protein [Pelagicoccus sp. SDUM812003]